MARGAHPSLALQLAAGSSLVLAGFFSYPFFVYLVHQRSPQRVQVQVRNRESTVPYCAQCPEAGEGFFTIAGALTKTALVSYPGSGHRWVASLMTTATGILVGSVYNSSADITVQSAKDIRAAVVLATVTHESPYDKKHPNLQFQRNILLIRNPYKALLSAFMEENSPGLPYSETQSVQLPPRSFLTEWPEWLSRHMESWQDFYLGWILRQVPTHVLVYSRLTSLPETELKLLFRFLNETTLHPNMHCVRGLLNADDDESEPEMEVFTKEQRRQLNSAIENVRSHFQHRTGDTFLDFQLWKR